VSEPVREPPRSAEELLVRYAAGERDFGGANLAGANLIDADLRGADLCRATLIDANLISADLSSANLSGANLISASLSSADLSGADLRGANLNGADLSDADLSSAILGDANLSDANLNGADLRGADLRGVSIGRTVLDSIDLAPLCEATGALTHTAPSTIGDGAILRSLTAPNLHEFLVLSGVLDLLATYRIDALRSLNALGEVRLLHSTFISYGTPDEPFARKLYEALHRNGVTTFFFPEHAVPGERLHRMMRKGVNDFDRTVLVCSKNSLDRKGVLNEIEESLAREAREGGVSYLIPIALDDYVFGAWKPARQDIAQAVRDKIVGDFRGADADPVKFAAGLQRLIAALKK
jgi:hypothetical protein